VIKPRQDKKKNFPFKPAKKSNTAFDLISISRRYNLVQKYPKSSRFTENNKKNICHCRLKEPRN